VVIIFVTKAVLFLQSIQEPLKYCQIPQITIITAQREFASITQYIFHFLHVVGSIEYDHTIAFIQLCNYDAIRELCASCNSAHISMMVLPLFKENIL